MRVISHSAQSESHSFHNPSRKRILHSNSNISLITDYVKDKKVEIVQMDKKKSHCIYILYELADRGQSQSNFDWYWGGYMCMLLQNKCKSETEKEVEKKRRKKMCKRKKKPNASGLVCSPPTPSDITTGRSQNATSFFVACLSNPTIARNAHLRSMPMLILPFSSVGTRYVPVRSSVTVKYAMT